MIRRPALMVAWVLELWLALVVALAAALWVWSGSEGSLATALQLAARTLPDAQQLLTENVRGNLRAGGQIARLRWANQGLSIELQRIDFRWDPWALVERRLVVEQLRLGELTIDDQRPASAEPLQDLLLPLQFDVALTADRVRWIAKPELRADAVTAHYRYDGVRHKLTLDGAQVAQGSYRGQASLLARTPLTLDLQVQGQVRVPVAERQITLDAKASLLGPLAGGQAPLQLVADLQPGPGNAGLLTGTGSMRAHLSGRIDPWATQPILEAQARYSQLDLAALWPDAPRTSLTGEAQVQPRGAGWQATVRLLNALPGPWDKHQLPFAKTQAVVGFAAGAWTIESLRAEGAGGSLELQGRLDTRSASLWQGRAQLVAINPAQLHSQLAPARLGGSVLADSNGKAVQFNVSLQPSGAQPPASPLAGLRLQRATARGSWADGWLRLQELVLQTDDVLLQGPLDVQPAQRSARGQLQVELPGARGRLAGQLAPQDGNADLTLDITDAGRLTAWLRRLPSRPATWTLPDLQGRADLVLNWQGGWQALQAGKTDTPRVQATLQIPALTMHTPGRPATDNLRVQGARITLGGTPGALTLAASGNGALGARRLALQSEAQGGRTPTGDWRVTLKTLKVDLQDDPRPGTWSLALRDPMLLEWLPDLAGGSLRSAATQAQVTGPLPGLATLQVQPLVWSLGGRGSLSSQGQLRGLPMEWLALLGSTRLADLGLSGNMVFDASWDVAANETLKATATLVRRSGDIRVLAESLPGSLDAGTAVNAGVRDARVVLGVDGETVTVAARWDSERAGTAQADVSSRLVHNADGWQWPALAPLAGNVQARLPQVGVWSMLAPPGWRMRGTLDANLTLTGSRQSPHWSGQIQADDLAVRSVVDGVEFGNGRLRARMLEQRLFIEEFNLQGAGGAAGGTLNATGYALWLPAGSTDSSALSRVRIDIDATATALRVSARADRRMVVSGTVQARLRDSRLDIQGTLKADQALFVLPDETAPRLGDDVVVRGSGSTRASAPSAATAASTTPGTAVQTTLAMALDLGPDFRVQGRGIITRLAGTLQLRSTAGELPRLTGEVRTVRGSYKAYGQLLDIEQGLMRFTGPYDNPVLDIIAVRPNLVQRVGVQITGSAFAPRVRLFSEPELPDAEKLAWLVLGRSGANGGAEAAVLQQAAMALLGRNGQGLSGGLANALGLDELSFAGAASRTDGTTAGATVTLGKRISRDFYVAYERSLAGTLGTISIFYDLSRRFTLRASTGEQSAIDLIFTIRYD